ncbi:MAG: AMP-binding protein [Arthrobacter sp.]|jgi:fatty-acyl-CoA synthase|nr:AMP-binding protein [Arthrobacter sp.]
MSQETKEPAYTAGIEELELPEVGIGEHFASVAARHGDRPAVIEASTGRELSYAELLGQARLTARGLLAAGLAPGDRVGIYSPNCAEWTVLQYGAALAGLILVNLNPAYRVHELAYVLRQCSMSALVVAPPDARSDAPALARQVAAEAPALRTLVMLPAPGEIGPDSYGHARSGTHLLGTAEGRRPLTELTWGELLDGAGAVSQEQLEERVGPADPHAPINLQYTSGTTGFPKGVTLTHHNLLGNGFHIGELLRYTEHDAVVLPVPLFHCFGMVIGNLAALSHGAATILPSRGFEAPAALAAVQRYGATSLYGVPTMFIAELNLPDATSYDLSTLRTGVMAGSPCPEEIMRKVISQMHMSEVAICYGMTETSPVSTMTRIGDSLIHQTQTVGRTMPRLESKIVDPATGELLRRGESGELCTRGYSVMAGYWDQPEQTAAAIDSEGWMHTGDLASMGEDGYIAIEGRIKDLIIRGGENISPREVEEFLYSHPLIQDVQVIGVPDERLGEEVMACVVLMEGVDGLTIEELREFSAGRIAHYKIPRYLRVLPAFPMTVSGKVRKVELREEAAAELAAEREPS